MTVYRVSIKIIIAESDTNSQVFERITTLKGSIHDIITPTGCTAQTSKQKCLTKCHCTLGFAFGLAFGLLADLTFDWAGTFGLALAAVLATLDWTRGLDLAAAAVDFGPLGRELDLGLPEVAAPAFALACGLSLARALSTASKPIKFPVTYDGWALTRGGMYPGPFDTMSLPSSPLPFPVSSNRCLWLPVYLEVSVIRSKTWSVTTVCNRNCKYRPRI